MKMFNDLTPGELLSLRINRRMAYKAGQYKFRAPDVCSVRWDDEAWMNWVQFDNPELTGFLPYTNQSAED